MIVCIAEKPSVARDIAKVLGANQAHDGYMEGNGYQVTWTFGHLCTLKEPQDYTDQWKAWALTRLPMIPQRFGIKLIADKGVEKQFKIIESLFQKADSIVNALKGGADFKELAQKYSQTGDSAWITTAQYQQAALDADNAAFVNVLYNMTRGEVRKLKFTNGNTVILKVEDLRNPVTKYNVAAIIKELRFSDDTYSSEYNKFSSFVAANPTLEQMEANAEKSGYTLRPISDLSSSQHNIAGIHNTRDAVKWLFDDANKGSISQLYECGDNDHLLVVALTGINPEGYASQDKVAESIKQELLNDKKMDKLLALAKDVKDITAAQALKGAVTDTVSHISFANPAFISATMSSEPIVSAVASRTAKGQFAGPFKGNGGVYLLQVLDKTATQDKYDAKEEEAQAANMNFRYVSQSLLNDLYQRANVKDYRYKFF